MKAYSELSREELMELREQLLAAYEEKKALGLNLDMSRGKPSPTQLGVSVGLMDVINSDSDMKSECGIDCRNYGCLDGIPEVKRLMAEMMGTTEDHIFIGGNASLTLMFDTVSRAYTHGIMGETPWCKLDKVKFLCPVPGYDRHFAITEEFGVEMINIPMTEDGPDMDMVEKYVNNDASVKGIWCVPKYSNPQGVVYSDETVERFAKLKPAADDFRIFWDNAYTVHHLYDDKQAEIPNILELCEKEGNPDMVFEFCSTSKVTFAGAGIAAIASSKANLDDMRKSMTIQTIGYDKINQLRHVRYLKDRSHTLALMQRHAAVLAPKFRAVLTALEQLAPLDIAQWTRPTGGYFISLDAMPGTARRALELCREAGVTMTGAGATYPYGVDPADSNIRIAPSLPPVEELEQAMQIFCLALRMAALERLGL